MTSIVVHLIAVVSLRSHKIGRWYAVLIILAGITHQNILCIVLDKNID